MLLTLYGGEFSREEIPYKFIRCNFADGGSRRTLHTMEYRNYVKEVGKYKGFLPDYF